MSVVFLSVRLKHICFRVQRHALDISYFPGGYVFAVRKSYLGNGLIPSFNSSFLWHGGS